jgi:phenylacetate-CoA ligase
VTRESVKERCSDINMSEYFRVAFGVSYDLYFLLRHVRWRREEVLKHQNQRVRKIIKYAYQNVPFYHEKLKKLDLKPDDIKSIDDLVRLPIIRRNEIQENSKKMISNAFETRKLRFVSTSGSTGRPLKTYITTEEDALRKAKILRANIICGQKPRDRWVVITAPVHQASTYALQKLFGIYSPIPLSVFETANVQIAKLQTLQPDVLDGYSSSLLMLAKEIKGHGESKVKPRIVIGGAELIDHPSRQFIEDVFGVPFFDQYACVELERLAWQCRERNGYHIDADSVVMEFVDENGEAVGPGETGEIVCTSLFNYAMPFIRYSTGDVGRPSRVEKCNCGITFPKMELVEGRKDSLIVLPGGRVLSPLAFGWIMEFFKYYHEIDQYRIVQKKIDLFQVIIKARNDTFNEDVLRGALHEHLQRMLSSQKFEITFVIKFVKDIKLEKSGKLRKVVSEIEENVSD